MVMGKVKSGHAYDCQTHCRVCKKEFEINLFQLERHGAYCRECKPELYKDGGNSHSRGS